MDGSGAGGEWLEVDGLGGYAMGTASGVRTRRYHGLLVTAVTPPTRRVVLLAGLEVWVEGPNGRTFLSSHRYVPDTVHPDGAHRIESFSADPWPRWTLRLDDGTRLVHEVLIAPGAPRVALAWRVLGAVKALALVVRPLLAFRHHHELGHERSLALEARTHGRQVVFALDPELPPLVALANGSYTGLPEWYRNFLYTEERARGFDATEDLASPGVFRFDLIGREAALVFAARGDGLAHDDNAGGLVAEIKVREAKRRARRPTPLGRAAGTYVVRRGDGLSIMAGYPWFTDWGRDTFIALRGACLARGRLEEARLVLKSWAGAIDGGMVPSRFGDAGEAVYESVDASLWFVVAAGLFLERARLPDGERGLIVDILEQILRSYLAGARHGIRVDADGLLAAGEPGVQLTWMDARVGERLVTPRIGKPVEVQALWMNALTVGSRFWNWPAEPLARARAAFDRRFWHEAGGHLYDVVDCDHVPGRVDAAFRANQLFAVGGLPVAVLAGPRARRLVELAELKLWTPAGPRSLAPGEAGYAPRYAGGQRERDAAYHQGTVWPYLAGAFIEAWVRTRGDSPAARREARARFFAPLIATLDPAGTGHLPEIADAEPPHAPRGCPFQAWSVAEALRLDLEVLDGAH